MKTFIFFIAFFLSIFAQENDNNNTKSNEPRKSRSRIYQAINKNEKINKNEEKSHPSKEIETKKEQDNSSQSSSFYEIEIKGEKIVFILDYSGSMQQEVIDQEITTSQDKYKSKNKITRFDI